MMMFGVVLGGFHGGLFTPTEAAGVWCASMALVFTLLRHQCDLGETSEHHGGRHKTGMFAIPPASVHWCSASSSTDRDSQASAGANLAEPTCRRSQSSAISSDLPWSWARRGEPVDDPVDGPAALSHRGPGWGCDPVWFRVIVVVLQRGMD